MMFCNKNYYNSAFILLIILLILNVTVSFDIIRPHIKWEGCDYLKCKSDERCFSRRVPCDYLPCPQLIHCAKTHEDFLYGPSTCDRVYCSDSYVCSVVAKNCSWDLCEQKLAKCFSRTESYKFPASCLDHKCPPDEQCMLEEASCSQPPCKLSPICAKKEDVHLWFDKCKSLGCLSANECYLRRPAQSSSSSQIENLECLARSREELLDLEKENCRGLVCPKGEKCYLQTKDHCTDKICKIPACQKEITSQPEIPEVSFRSDLSLTNDEDNDWESRRYEGMDYVNEWVAKAESHPTEDYPAFKEWLKMVREALGPRDFEVWLNNVRKNTVNSLAFQRWLLPPHDSEYLIDRFQTIVNTLEKITHKLINDLRLTTTNTLSAIPELISKAISPLLDINNRQIFDSNYKTLLTNNEDLMERLKSIVNILEKIRNSFVNQLQSTSSTTLSAIIELISRVLSSLDRLLDPKNCKSFNPNYGTQKESDGEQSAVNILERISQTFISQLLSIISPSMKPLTTTSTRVYDEFIQKIRNREWIDWDEWRVKLNANTKTSTGKFDEDYSRELVAYEGDNQFPSTSENKLASAPDFVDLVEEYDNLKQIYEYMKPYDELLEKFKNKELIDWDEWKVKLNTTTNNSTKSILSFFPTVQQFLENMKNKEFIDWDEWRVRLNATSKNKTELILSAETLQQFVERIKNKEFIDWDEWSVKLKANTTKPSLSTTPTLQQFDGKIENKTIDIELNATTQNITNLLNATANENTTELIPSIPALQEFVKRIENKEFIDWDEWRVKLNVTIQNTTGLMNAATGNTTELLNATTENTTGLFNATAQNTTELLNATNENAMKLIMSSLKKLVEKMENKEFINWDEWNGKRNATSKNTTKSISLAPVLQQFIDKIEKKEFIDWDEWSVKLNANTNLTKLISSPNNFGEKIGNKELTNEDESHVTLNTTATTTNKTKKFDEFANTKFPLIDYGKDPQFSYVTNDTTDKKIEIWPKSKKSIASTPDDFELAKEYDDHRKTNYMKRSDDYDALESSVRLKIYEQLFEKIKNKQFIDWDDWSLKLNAAKNTTGKFDESSSKEIDYGGVNQWTIPPHKSPRIEVDIWPKSRKKLAPAPDFFESANEYDNFKKTYDDLNVRKNIAQLPYFLEVAKEYDNHRNVYDNKKNDDDLNVGKEIGRAPVNLYELIAKQHGENKMINDSLNVGKEVGQIPVNLYELLLQSYNDDKKNYDEKYKDQNLHSEEKQSLSEYLFELFAKEYIDHKKIYYNFNYNDDTLSVGDKDTNVGKKRAQLPELFDLLTKVDDDKKKYNNLNKKMKIAQSRETSFESAKDYDDLRKGEDVPNFLLNNGKSHRVSSP